MENVCQQNNSTIACVSEHWSNVQMRIEDKNITLSKHKKAASRYTFDFLLHATQTALCIAFGKLESSAVIAA
jgi:hypothetical protein